MHTLSEHLKSFEAGSALMCPRIWRWRCAGDGDMELWHFSCSCRCNLKIAASNGEDADTTNPICSSWPLIDTKILTTAQPRLGVSSLPLLWLLLFVLPSKQWEYEARDFFILKLRWNQIDPAYSIGQGSRRKQIQELWIKWRRFSETNKDGIAMYCELIHVNYKLPIYNT